MQPVSLSSGEEARDLLKEAKRQLEGKGNPSALLDARLLLQYAAGLSHEALIAEPERKIPATAVKAFRDFLARRLAGEPVSRIQGEREFYGRAFAITPATLDPRPDTETLIEAALSLIPAGKACRLIDLGTGTGIIAVTLLAERPQASAMMTDISAEALAVARANAERHGVLERASFARGNWFAGTQGAFDLVLSNPPYIPQAILPTLAPEVRDFDPVTALVGGVDGLESYREIAETAGPFLAPQGYILVEIGDGQAVEIVEIFRKQRFAHEHQWRDLAGHVRTLGFSHA